jgi:hypothetical protein
MKKSFPAAKDAWVNSNIYIGSRMQEKPYEYQTVEQYNSGAAEELRVDGYYLVPVLDFDLAELKGKKIKRATLVLHWIHNPVEEWDVGTISHDWEEGTGKGYKSKVDGISLHQCGKDTRWPENSIFNYFTLGNSNSRHQVVRPKNKGEDRQEIELDPLMIYSLIYRENFGLSLYDTRADVFSHFSPPWNYYDIPKWLHSRHTKAQGKAPCLNIEYEDGGDTVPAISDLEISHFMGIGAEKRGLKVRWRCKDGGDFVRFDMKLNGRNVARYKTSLFDGRTHLYEAILDDLKPDTLYKVEVGGVSPAGVLKSATGSLKTRKRRRKLAVQKAKVLRKGSAAVLRKGGLSVYALDEMHKVDAIKGKACLNNGKWARSYNNTLVEKGAIKLQGGLNEVLGLQLLFNSAKPGQFSLVPFGEDIPDLKFFRQWYTKQANGWIPDALIPIEHAHFTLPAVDNDVPGQKVQGLFVDVLLNESAARTISFKLGIYRGGKLLAMVPVEIDVQAFTLDERGAFIFEMNNYNFPHQSFGNSTKGRQAATPEGTRIDREFYKLCHEHRTEMDVLTYNHFGEVNEGCVPVLAGEGADVRVADWTAFDETYGPLIEGTVFKDGHRTYPLRQLYLPFHENWPMPINKYYKPKVKLNQPLIPLLNEHKKKSWNIEQDFDPAYREGMKNVLKDFMIHFDEKGWHDVLVFYFFNNKYYWKNPHRNNDRYKDATCWWLLDEPFYYDDWRALRFFGSIIQEAKDELSGLGSNFHFRLDVSWPAQFHHFDNGCLGINVTSSKNGLTHSNWFRRRSLLHDEHFWMYGSVNPPNVPDTNTYASMMRFYSVGGEGFLPWLAFRGDSSLDKAESTSVVYTGERFGIKGPVGSMRLKSVRRLMQDFQYLSQVARMNGIDRFGEEEILRSLITIASQAEMANSLDAGRTSSAMKLHEPAVLRESLRPYLLKKG